MIRAIRRESALRDTPSRTRLRYGGNLGKKKRDKERYASQDTIVMASERNRMRYILTGGVVRHIAIKITRRLYGFRMALSYFQTRYDVYHVLSDDILPGDVCFELTGHS